MVTPWQPGLVAHRCRANERARRLRDASPALPGLLHIHEEGIGQRKLTLMPHPRAWHISARQADSLLRPSVTKPKRSRDNGRGRRLDVEAIRVAQVGQSVVPREQIGEPALELRRRRNRKPARNHRYKVKNEYDAHSDPRPRRPRANRHRAKPGRPFAFPGHRLLSFTRRMFFGDLMNHTRRLGASQKPFEFQLAPTTPIHFPFYPINLFVPFSQNDVECES